MVQQMNKVRNWNQYEIWHTKLNLIELSLSYRFIIKAIYKRLLSNILMLSIQCRLNPMLSIQFRLNQSTRTRSIINLWYNIYIESLFVSLVCIVIHENNR
jgi:hypothetical protein